MTRGDPDNLGRADRPDADGMPSGGGASGSDAAEEALDALLGAARWPEPPAAAVARLHAGWATCSPAGRAPPRRSRWAWAAAAAAAIVVAGSALPLIVGRSPATPTAASGVGTATATPGTSPAASADPASSPSFDPSSAHAADGPRGQAVSAAGPASTVPSRPASLSERWAMLAARPPAGGGTKMSASPQPGGARPESATVRLPSARPPSARPSPAATGTPAGMARRPADAAGRAVDPAVRGLFGWVTGSSEVRRRLAALSAADGPAARQAVVGRWLAAAAPADLDAFLAAVLARGWRDDALAAWRRHAAPPVGPLFARLDDPLVDRRFAAAWVLGAAGDDAVRAALERMVRDNANRREALAALLCSGDRRAARFLDATARADRSVDAQLGVVRLDLRRLF